jgi:hypothetical protein
VKSAKKDSIRKQCGRMEGIEKVRSDHAHGAFSKGIVNKIWIRWRGKAVRREMESRMISMFWPAHLVD